MSQHLISKLSIAPMIDWSYSHFRVFMRLLLPKALVYTEMQTMGAIEHNAARALYFNPIEPPIALQVGGAEPAKLAACASVAATAGFQEINLNLGCPSDRVQSGHFGACMMADPKLAAACIKEMKSATNITVSAKTRIGIDDQDSYSYFYDFIQHLVEAGCDKIIVHARKAWLKGLSPKQNRTIPPLHYDYVFRLKEAMPELPIVINGQINTVPLVEACLKHLDGVMIGRLACQNPYLLHEIYQAIYQVPSMERYRIVYQYSAYMQEAFAQGENLSLLLKPLFNLAHGLKGSRHWKQLLMNILKQKDLTQLESLISYFENDKTIA